MDHTLQSFSELCRDPILSVEQGRISWMNAAARKCFPQRRPGDAATGLLPEYILQETAETFVTGAVLDGHSYTVSAARVGDEALLLTLVPAPAEGNVAYVSDSLISGMRSALCNIELSAEHLRRHLDTRDGESEMYLAMLLHNYYALHHKLSNLCLMRQICDSGIQLSHKFVDLVDLCRGLVLSTNHLVPKGLAPIEFVCALDSLPACMDAAKVELLIVNLLSNALKHTPPDGHIRLGLSKSGGNAVISVDDDGDGIASEVLNGVFHAYETRLDEQSLSRADTGGLGLGICRAIAEQHGGALILDSREQKGTSIRLMLPLRAQDLHLSSERPPYENGGMVLLLTELSDVLDWQAYRGEYLD